MADYELHLEFLDYFSHCRYNNDPDNFEDMLDQRTIWRIEKYINAGYAELLGPYPRWVAKARFPKAYQEFGRPEDWGPNFYVMKFTQKGKDALFEVYVAKRVYQAI